MAMARPMGRPSSPPFALITTVVLFVIAAAAAVALYVQWTKAQEERDAYKADLQKVQGNLNTLKSQIKTLTDVVIPGVGRPEDLSAAGKVKTELDSLLNTIKQDPTGTDTFAGWTAKAAIQKLDTTQTRLYERLRQTDQKLAAAATQLQSTRDTLRGIEAKVAAIDEKNLKDRADLVARHKTEIDKAKRDVGRLTSETKGLNQQLAKLKIEHHAKDNQQNEVIVRKDYKIRELQELLKKRDPEMVNKIRNGPMKLSDGSVAEVYPEQNVVYLRLKRPEQAKLGMRYVIVSKGQRVPDNGDGKADVEISSTEGGAIQAKIVRSTPGNPIIPGDMAMNVVTGPRVFNFVVFGNFDLNNDQMIEPNGKAQIEALITRWGGKIQKDIDISSNFVVLGSQPPLPASAPAPGADALVIEDYNRKAEANKKWAALHDRALQHTIPVLNTTTFLHWVGYYNRDTAPGWQKRVRPGEDYFPGS